MPRTQTDAYGNKISREEAAKNSQEVDLQSIHAEAIIEEIEERAEGKRKMFNVRN